MLLVNSPSRFINALLDLSRTLIETEGSEATPSRVVRLSKREAYSCSRSLQTLGNARVSQGRCNGVRSVCWSRLPRCKRTVRLASSVICRVLLQHSCGLASSRTCCSPLTATTSGAELGSKVHLQKTAISGNGLEASVAGSKDTYRSSALAHPNHLSAIQMGGSIPPALL